MKRNFIIHPFSEICWIQQALIIYQTKKENKKYSNGNENKLFWYKTDETMNYQNWQNHGLENDMTKGIHHIPTVKSGMDLVNKIIA